MQVGDKVRVLTVENAGVDEKYVGQIGTVVTLDSDAEIEFDDGDAWFFQFDDIAPAYQVFIVVDQDDNITAEHLSLKAAEDDAHGSAKELKEEFTVYQRIVSFGVKTEVVETRG